MGEFEGRLGRGLGSELLVVVEIPGSIGRSLIFVVEGAAAIINN